MGIQSRGGSHGAEDQGVRVVVVVVVVVAAAAAAAVVAVVAVVAVAVADADDDDWLYYSKRIIVVRSADLSEFFSLIFVGEMCVLFHVQ